MNQSLVISARLLPDAKECQDVTTQKGLPVGSAALQNHPDACPDILEIVTDPGSHVDAVQAIAGSGILNTFRQLQVVTGIDGKPYREVEVQVHLQTGSTVPSTIVGVIAFRQYRFVQQHIQHTSDVRIQLEVVHTQTVTQTNVRIDTTRQEHEVQGKEALGITGAVAI